MAQASRDQAGQTFDVIVVGSGASGGWAAKRLSEAGINVALLDAGRALTDADYKEHAAAYTLEYRNRANDRIRETRSRQKDCYACTEYNYDWFVNDNDEPYTTPQGKPFSWQGRTRIIGGRTNVWGRQSYRFSDYDFKAASIDGHGIDWPIAYKDLESYYDIVEEYVGISGMPENDPMLPDSKFHPADGASTASEAPRPQRRQEDVQPHADHRPRRQHHQADQRPRAVSLLWPLRARVRDALVLQLGLHDRCRRAQDRQVHPHPERDGVPGADGCQRQEGARRVLRRSPDAAIEGGQRPGGDPGGPGARVGAHPAEQPRGRPRQQQRRTRQVPDGSHVGGRRRERRSSPTTRRSPA